MTVYVIDNHPIMSDQIAMLIRRIKPGIKVVTIQELDQLQGAIQGSGAPELICLELQLPDTFGTSGVQLIRSSYPDIPLAVITSLDATTYASASIHAGANIFIEKTKPVIQVISSLRVLLQGPTGDEGAGTPALKLTKRQKQLILLLDRGLSNREIAEKLNVAEHTVKVHLWRFFSRIGATNRAQALHFCRHNGWL